MTAKEKASELILIFSECGEDKEMYIETAKKCAALHVKILIGEISKNRHNHFGNIEFWTNVYYEINGL